MNVRQVRKKIKSVTSVRKITQAMQLVSAVKMKKAQNEALNGKPYQQFLEETISKFTRKIDTSLSELLKPKENAANRDLAVVVTSNKGLCGAFNINLIRLMTRRIDLKKTDFITLGKKGSTLINQLGGNILADFSTSTFEENASAVINIVIDNFLGRKNSRALLFYNKFISTLRHDPTEEILLPFSLIQKGEMEEFQETYTVEPDPQDFIDTLLRNYLEERIRYSLIENEAGEHSARMIAMKNATDNADDVLYNLTLLRNKLRQQKITYELLDMITATQSVTNL